MSLKICRHILSVNSTSWLCWVGVLCLCGFFLAQDLASCGLHRDDAFTLLTTALVQFYRGLGGGQDLAAVARRADSRSRKQCR